jgi:hypothetical protein
MAQEETINMTNDEEPVPAESYSGGDEAAGEYASSEGKSGNRSMFILLGLVLAGAAVFWVMRARRGPEPAKVDDRSIAAQAAINQFLASGNQNVKAMEAMLRNTEKLVQRFSSFPNVSQVPLAELHTNPFRMGQAAVKPAVDTEAAAKKKQEEERQAALKAVQSLALQSIVYGDARRACMINGELLQEGQQVSSFTVEKISADAVVVKTGVYRFELRMQK